MNRAHNVWLAADSAMKDARKEYRDNPNNVTLMNYSRAYDRLSVSSRMKDSVHDYFARIAESKIDEGGIIEDFTGPIGSAEVYASFPELSEGWHNTRREGIGGSEAGKLLGIDWRAAPGSKTFRTIDDSELEALYDETVKKKSKHITIDDNEVEYGLLQRGHQWERVSVAYYAMTRGVRVAQSKDTFQGPEEFQHVNVDGLVLDDNGDPVGLLECKTTGRKSYWSNGIPLSYRVQVLYYLHAVGLPWADVIVRYDEDGTFDVFHMEATDTVTGHPDAMDINDVIRQLSGVWSMIKKRRSDDYTTQEEQEHARIFNDAASATIANVDVSIKKTNIFDVNPASVILTGVTVGKDSVGPFGTKSTAVNGWIEPSISKPANSDCFSSANDIVNILDGYDVIAVSNPEEATVALEGVYGRVKGSKMPMIVSSAAIEGE